MRIGIHGGVSGRADNAITELIESARQAHENGLDYWVPQLTDVDALTALAVIGREVPGLEVGTAVVPTYPRHPMVMAMQALTVQAATGNHLVLGIGLSHQVVIEGAFGLSFATPVRHMREYLSVLMPLLHEGKVTYEGEEITARTFAPMRVAGAEAPTVLVAALGSQMLKLAGRMADGTALWMVGPKTIADHIVPTITKAADDAGRPAPDVTVGLPVCVTNQPDEAIEKAASTFGFYNNLPSYRAMLDREGAGGPADVAVVGDEETVAARLHHLGQIGATRLSLPVFGTKEERARTLALLQELAG
ncbi:MAG TPA: LLM class F420-dependent oxidoreductase [Acidimicrobiales bacterium]|jgi:F420-dependent oxidoreductase-like protein|nr:LLM class F420-dependent oxidoreductase [Acidimicrobiales bacterium]